MVRKALLIGVSQYAEGLESLPATPNDVEAMRRVLQDPDLGGFDGVEPLINPDLQTMQEAIQTLFADSRKDDLVLLYFSGHGITDDNGILYLTTCRTRKDRYQATSVPARFVHGVMRDSYSKQQVVILDCCYSGAFAEGWRAKKIGAVDLKQLGGEGRAVLSSSTSTETSFEQEGLSIYTRFLVEGIETGAADIEGDRLISVDELHQYAKEKVQEAKPAMQPQICISEKEGFRIVLAQVKVNDASLEYRRLVERYAKDGQISQIADQTLEINRKRLKLSVEQASEIKNSVLEPFRERQQHLQQYEEALVEAIKHERPLSDRTLNELKDLQRYLGLRDEDIAPIHQRLIPQVAPRARKPNRIVKLWYVFAFLVIVGFIIIIITQIIPNYTAGVLHNQAFELQTSGQNEAALKVYDQVVQKKPDFYQAWTDRGYVLGKLHRYPESLKSCEAAIKIKRDSSFALNCTGLALQNLQRYNEAIAAYTQAIELDSNSPEFFSNRGESLLKSKRYTEAITDFDQALKLNPNFGFAWTNKGRVHSKIGEYSQAVNAFEKATQLNPNSYYAWIDLGDALKKSNRNEEAITAYQKATSIKPNTHEDWYLTGQAFEKLGQTKAAIAAYNEAIKIAPAYQLAIYAKQRLQQQ